MKSKIENTIVVALKCAFVLFVAITFAYWDIKIALFLFKSQSIAFIIALVFFICDLWVFRKDYYHLRVWYRWCRLNKAKENED